MELSAEEKKDFSTPQGPKAPKYPSGLLIRIEPEQVERLGISTAPSLGEKFKLEGIVEVQRVAKEHEEGDEGPFSVSLQITEMYLESPEKEKQDTATVMYSSQGE